MDRPLAVTAPGRREDSRGLAGGVARVALAASALGTLGPVSNLAYGAGIAPATFSALRAAVGASVLAGLVASGRQPSVSIGGLPARQRAALAAAITVNGLMNLALFLAFGAMTVAVVMVIYYTYPLLVAVMSVALGRERMTATRAASLALAAVGLALVLGAKVGPGAEATAVGLGLAATAGICQAVYLVIVREGFPSVPPAQATALVLGGGVLVSGTAALLTGVAFAGGWLASPAAWAAILFAGTVGAALPKVWVIAGVRVVGSTRAAVLMLMEPIVAVAVAAAVLAQAPSAPELVGGAAVLVAVLVVQRPDPAADPEPVPG